MGPFAHLGLTAGAAVLINSVWNYRREPDAKGRAPGEAARKPGFWKPLSFSATLAVLFGSLVSDAVDKPLGGFFFADYYSNGRIFCHTLVFSVVIFLLGWIVWRSSGKNRLLLIAFGIFMHLLLDEMWREPRTLFWPLMGWQFPRYPPKTFTGWLMGVLRGIITSPGILLSEIVGLGLLVWLEAPVFIAELNKWRARRRVSRGL